MSGGVVEINGRFYTEVTQPQTTAKPTKKPKKKPKTKQELKTEIWAFILLAGFALILWAATIIKSCWDIAGADKVNNTEKKITTKR